MKVKWNNACGGKHLYGTCLAWNWTNPSASSTAFRFPGGAYLLSYYFPEHLHMPGVILASLTKSSVYLDLSWAQQRHIYKLFIVPSNAFKIQFTLSIDDWAIPAFGTWVFFVFSYCRLLKSLQFFSWYYHLLQFYTKFLFKGAQSILLLFCSYK